MTRHITALLADPIPGDSPTIEVRSPYSGTLLATVEGTNEANAERALEVAYALFRDKKSWLRPELRGRVLEHAATVMHNRYDELVETATSEGGKPLVDSRIEVTRAIDGVKLCYETIRNEAGQVVPVTEPTEGVSRLAFTQKEPIGVVLAFSAFNHPLNLIVHQVATAVAAGCPVIVKPASTTPLSCYKFVEILHECGLPRAWCQMVMPESHALSGRMASDHRVAFFSFIGSARVGWQLRSRLAAGTRAALEHGGGAPVIVDRSADIDKMIPLLLKGGYYHAGQVCVSVQRVFVHESQMHEVAERLRAGAEQLVVGDPLDGDTDVGPLIRASEVDRIDEWVKEAVDDGAEVLAGGTRIDNNCYAPTLLLNPSQTVRVSRQEVFGPLICLYSYSDTDTAIDQANSLEVAFQAAVFAQDIDRAVDIYHKLDAATVMINDHTAFRQDGMPFAGLRESGLGIGGIPYTIEEMQIEKMMVIRSVLPKAG
jgi:acyl-CoA reductase-like NAD-dependent aldehyde dehydrogenase